MRLSFIIPAYNEETYLPACLAALEKETAQSGVDSEIIVVNNASTDRTQEVAMRFSGVTVVAEPKKGLPYARQRGFETSTGDIVVCFDADTRIAKDWIQKVITLFEQNPGVVAVTGPYDYYDFPLPWRPLAASYRIIAGNVGNFLTGQVVCGGNMAIRKEALQSIGGFNTDIKFYGEDIDTARRLQKIGRVLYTDKLTIEASARRFHGQGVLKTTRIYAENVISFALLNRPVEAEARDFR